MSDRIPPPPRRRIAGEAPVTPVANKAAPAKKAAVKKPAAKKAPAAAAAKKAPARKVSVDKTSPAQAAVSTAVEASTDVESRQVARPSLKPRTERVATGGSPPTSRWAIAAAAIVLIAGAAVGALGFAHWRSDDFTASRTTAVSAASSAAETIFSFSYDKLDQHTTESKALMTAKYGKEFDTIVPTLTDVAPQRKVTVEAVTRNAAALPCGNECSATQASVLIFIDQDRRLADDDTSTVFGNRIVVDMVEADGEWKVSDIRAL